MQKDVATNSVSAIDLIDAAKSDSKVGCGTSSPLGATVHPEGVNFSVFSKNATLVELLLFESADAIAHHARGSSGPADSSHLSLLARFRAPPEAGPNLRIQSTWSIRA